MFRYGEDFFNGDVVQIANEYGHETKARILEIVMSENEEGTSVYPTFKTITEEVYNKLYDNGYRTYNDLLDSLNGVVIDNNVESVVGRSYSSELVLDSSGNPIADRVIFVTK